MVETDRQTDRQTGRDRDRQTDRQTDRDKQTDRQRTHLFFYAQSEREIERDRIATTCIIILIREGRFVIAVV